MLAPCSDLSLGLTPVLFGMDPFATDRLVRLAKRFIVFEARPVGTRLKVRF